MTHVWIVSMWETFDDMDQTPPKDIILGCYETEDDAWDRAFALVNELEHADRVEYETQKIDKSKSGGVIEWDDREFRISVSAHRMGDSVWGAVKGAS